MKAILFIPLVQERLTFSVMDTTGCTIKNNLVSHGANTLLFSNSCREL